MVTLISALASNKLTAQTVNKTPNDSSEAPQMGENFIKVWQNTAPDVGP